MAVIFKDTFQGSGDLASRVPDVGSAWDQYASGVIYDGHLSSYNDSSFNTFAGEVPLPTREYAAITVRLLYVVTGLSDATIYVSFSGSLERDVMVAGFTAGIGRLSSYVSSVNPSALNRPGQNELIQSMDFDNNISRLYHNGVLLQEDQIPEDSAEQRWRPSGGAIGFSLGGSTDRFDGTQLEIAVSEIEITDTPYAPQASQFWTNMVRTAEAP